MAPRRPRLFLSAALLSAALGASAPARLLAQGMMPGMGGPMAPSAGQAQQAPKKDPNQPETHAAPGSGDDMPKPTAGEPTLPQDPLQVPDPVRKQLGSSAMGEFDGGSGERSFFTIPPYFQEKRGDYRFRTVFPLWLERSLPNDRASLYGGLYYQRRSPKESADVVFPFYWNWREERDRTVIAGPAGWHVGPKGRDYFLAPFFFHGTRPDGSYWNIPPLLTFLKRDKFGGRTIVGPGFCLWRGGAACDPNTADTIDYGVAPFFFAGKSDRSRYELAPPLLHYYRYAELDQSWLNIWGPVIRAHNPERDAFHVAPLFFHIWGKNEDHVTIPPLLFHYGHKANANLLITPAFLSARGEKGESTFVTWGYARHRGRTELDMITPLYWRYEDPDAKLERRLILPFLYTAEGPRESSLAIFPFYANFQRFGLSRETWVTPFFQHTDSVNGWSTNLHPFLYLGRDRQHTHTVVAPFFWDFATPQSRTTIGFPFYWRFADKDSVDQVALNTFYHERKVARGSEWEFHFFPLVSFGETPNGHWWNVLYGLAGYSRRGAEAKMKLFWVPVPLSTDF